MSDSLAALRPRHRTPAVPWWFERIVGACGSVVIGYGLVGMGLALVGWFRIGPGLALGTAFSYSIYAQWFRGSPRHPARAIEVWPALAVLAIAAGSVFFNWTAAGETMLSDGEAGVMTLAARHLDVTGSLTIEASNEVFSQARVGFVADGFAGTGVGGTLRSEVPHLTPVYRAAAGWFGWTPLLAVGSLFGAAALLAVYWFATRLVPPPLAAGAVAALALSLPFVQASRGFYPEIVALFSVFCALAILWGSSQDLRPWRGIIFGLLMGMPVLARPEWALLVIPVGLFLAIEGIATTEHSWSASRAGRRFLAAVLGGFLVPVIVAALDSARSGIDLGEAFELRRAATIVAVTAVTLAVLRVTGRALGEQPRFAYADMRRAFAYLVAGALVVGAVASFMRPQAAPAAEPSPVVAAVQAAEGTDVEPTRTYHEDTTVWLLRYLGPFAVAFGVAGLALIVVEAAGREDRASLPFLLVALTLLPATILSAGPTPVHVLASRRLLVMAIPVLLIGAAVLGHRIYDAAPRYVTRSTVAVAVGALLVLLTPLAHLRGITGLSDHRGARSGIEALCDLLDRDDAVLFAEKATAEPGAVAVQTVRDFCRVPAARAVDPGPDEVEVLAAAWREAGRRLVVVSAAPWADVGPSTRVQIEWVGLERTVESRPDGPERGSLALHVAPAG